jgi:hypothetical protein
MTSLSDSGSWAQSEKIEGKRRLATTSNLQNIQDVISMLWKRCSISKTVGCPHRMFIG